MIAEQAALAATDWLALGRASRLRTSFSPPARSVMPRAASTTPKDEQRLAEMVAAIRRPAEQRVSPPRITRRKFCRACAFEELCYG
jgi:hypothetical protein